MNNCNHDMTKETIFCDNYEFPFIICCECGATDEEIKLKAQVEELSEKLTIAEDLLLSTSWSYRYKQKLEKREKERNNGC